MQNLPDPDVKTIEKLATDHEPDHVETNAVDIDKANKWQRRSPLHNKGRNDNYIPKYIRQGTQDLNAQMLPPHQNTLEKHMAGHRFRSEWLGEWVIDWLTDLTECVCVWESRETHKYCT